MDKTKTPAITVFDHNIETHVIRLADVVVFRPVISRHELLSCEVDYLVDGAIRQGKVTAGSFATIYCHLTRCNHEALLMAGLELEDEISAVRNSLCAVEELVEAAYKVTSLAYEAAIPVEFGFDKENEG